MHPLPFLPPLISAQARLLETEHRAPAGFAFPPAARVLPSDPGESLALSERSLLLGH